MQKRTDLIANSRYRTLRATVMAPFLLLCMVPDARANVVACINSHTSAQREAKAGHLKAASELFASCAATDGCPDAIRVECVELHREVEKNVPTVIFAVTDEQGKDLTDVRVYSTDQLVVDSLDGRAVALDPGKYSFRFELPQGEALSHDVVVREGEKNRVVTVRQPVRTTKPALEPSPRPQASASTGQSGSLPTGFWLSAGIGSVALASFGAFALLGHTLQSQLDECSPNCDSSRRGDFDAMRRNYLIADISLAAAVASAGVATWFLLSNQPTSALTPERSARLMTPISVQPSIWAHGAGLSLRTRAF